LRGLVPSEGVHSTVLGMVKATFPNLEVEDRMRVAAGAPAVDQWLGAVSFGLQQLSHLKHGSVRLLDVGLRIDGEAGDAQDFTELQKSLGGALPTGLTIIGNNVRPPRIEPFVFVASLSPDTLALTGSVPNEHMRKRLRDLSWQLFERPTLDDRLELASGAPKNWNDAVIALLKALSRLESGKVSLTGLAVTIEGIARDKGTAADISSQLHHDLPSMFSPSEKISWKEAALLR
jgi:OOP family OmpA-OmpF porin